MHTSPELVVQLLERLGVDVVFGLPGTQNVELFDALRPSRIRTVVATHELAAGFMANGYARASGRVGVVVVIQGPGFTWALTALAEARHDSAPLLLVTGVPEEGRRFALQALDQEMMAGPVAKAVFRPRSVESVAESLAQAYALAGSGEPGPVVLELPEFRGARSPAPDRLPPLPEPPLPDLAELTGLIHQARRPVVYAGQGCAGGAADLRRLVETLNAPVATTLSGRGVVPEDHPLALGIDPGPSGVEALNRLFAGADLILALGCKLSHNGSAGFRLVLPADRLVHIDASAEVLGANYPARLALQADLPSLLRRLVPSVNGSGQWTGEEIDACRRSARLPDPVEPSIRGIEPPTPEGFFAVLRRALPRDAILTLDSGQHQMLARRYYRVFAPRGLLAPSDFQSMGFGLPAAIGAALAAPERPVVSLLGDGGFAMSGMELLTAAREGLPLVTVVFNDGRLGLIRQQQIREFGQAHGTALQPMDFEAFAAAVGVDYRLLDRRDPAGLLGEAVAARRPVLIEVLLGDSMAMRRHQAAGMGRAAVRRALGPRLIAALRRLLGR
jgi:acetolactate synthase-1/2/3 large subunit